MNWVDNETTITLKPLREVSSFDEVMALRDLNEDEDAMIFDITIKLFKRAFEDEEQQKLFFLEPMATVLDVLDEWLQKSYEAMNGNNEEEEDWDEEYSVDVTFDMGFLEEKENDTTVMAAGIIGLSIFIAIIVLGAILNAWWVIWAVAGILFGSLIYQVVLLIKAIKANKG